MGVGGRPSSNHHITHMTHSMHTFIRAFFLSLLDLLSVFPIHVHLSTRVLITPSGRFDTAMHFAE